MPRYQAPLRDMKFLLNEVLEIGSYSNLPRFADAPADVIDAVLDGVFTVPGDGSLDFEAIVGKLAGYGYEGWFVVEAEQDPVKCPPLKMAQIGHKELMRVMNAAGYDVVN